MDKDWGMIGRLQGIIAEKQPPLVLIDVQGVGYEVEAPMSVFYELPATGEPVTLRIHHVVRDDAHALYGFVSAREREVFRSLIRVSGVGPKLALTLLSGMRADEFLRCVELGDTATLSRLPGVGKKTAERLIMELQDQTSQFTPKTPATPTANATSGEASPPTNAVDEAINALVALGYKHAEASKLMDGLDTSEATSETLIREALRKAVR